MPTDEVDTSALSLGGVDRGSPTPASSFARLDVMKKGQKVESIAAGLRDVTVLGRNSRMAHVLLDHQSISRRHAAIVHNGQGGVFVVDLGSTHGSYLNGVRIPSKGFKKLGEGDILKFGESSRSYIFRLEGASATQDDPPPTITAHNEGVRSTEPPPPLGDKDEEKMPPPPRARVSAPGAAVVGPSGAGYRDNKSALARETPFPSPSPSLNTSSAGAPRRGQEGGRGGESEASGGEAERLAMLTSMLPLSFGAPRNKPLGRMKDKVAAAALAGAGAAATAVVAGMGGRDNPHDATRRPRVTAGAGGGRESEDRQRRAAEIAALTADLMRDKRKGEEEELSQAVAGLGGEAGDSSRAGGGSGAGANGGTGQPTGESRGRMGEEEEEEGEEEQAVDGEEEEEEMGEEREEQQVRQIIRRLSIPISHEVKLSSHHKGVMALAVDPAGGRVATGSNDFKVKLFDFGGMDKRHLPFREIEPEEGNVVVSLSYSNTGHAFLACTAGSQPKVYDRNGAELAHFVKGDPYLKDMVRTKGHVTRVTGGDWHPSKKSEVLTCSVDGSVRTWDLNGPLSFDNLTCKQVLKLRSKRALKLGCTSATYQLDGKGVAAGGQDGSLHFIPLNQPYARAEVVRDAHKEGCEVTSVSYNEDGHILATRATDETVKLWDVRKLAGGALKTLEVPTHLETANTSFSPDGRVLVCGTNVAPRTGDRGSLRFFDVFTADTTPQLEVVAAGPGASVIRAEWHGRTQQIAVTTSGGEVRFLYDPMMSEKGAMLSAGRTHKRLNANIFAPAHGVGNVHTPHALPMFREQGFLRKRKADRKDPVKSKKPDPPMPGRGVQGRISSSYNFHQYVLKEALVSQKNLLHEDPREELLKYDEATKKDKEYLGSAYKDTQPKGSELMETTLEQAEEDFKEEQRKLLDS